MKFSQGFCSALLPNGHADAKSSTSGYIDGAQNNTAKRSQHFSMMFEIKPSEYL